MKVVVVILILIFTFSFLYSKSKTKNPKVFIELESGERFIPEDSDYIDLDHKDNVSYKFDIYKIGVSQSLKNNKNYSIIYKTVNKDYLQSIDSISSDDNNINNLSAYYSFKLAKIYTLRLRANLRRRSYDEINSTKESKNLSNTLTVVVKPKDNNFFTDEKNEYTFNLKYKTTDYKYSPAKDSNEISYYLNWKRELIENLDVKLQYKSATLNYDLESAARLDATRRSYLVRAEYQF